MFLSSCISLKLFWCILNNFGYKIVNIVNSKYVSSTIFSMECTWLSEGWTSRICHYAETLTRAELWTLIRGMVQGEGRSKPENYPKKTVQPTCIRHELVKTPATKTPSTQHHLQDLAEKVTNLMCHLGVGFCGLSVWVVEIFIWDTLNIVLRLWVLFDTYGERWFFCLFRQTMDLVRPHVLTCLQWAVLLMAVQFSSFCSAI